MERKAKVTQILTAVLDLLLVTAGLAFAQLLWKGNPNHSLPGELRVWQYAPLIIVSHMLTLLLLGTYRVKWKYADIRDMLRLLCANVLGSFVCLLLNRLCKLLYPRFVIGFHGVFTFSMLAASRYVWLLIHNLRHTRKEDKKARRSLIIGADAEGTALADRLSKIDDGYSHEAAAFLDDDIEKIYRKFVGIPVEGAYADVSKVIEQKHVDEVLFTSNRPSKQATEYIYLSAVAAGCTVSEYRDGRFTSIAPEEILDSGTAAAPVLNGERALIIGCTELSAELGRTLRDCGAGKVLLAGADVSALGRLMRENIAVRLVYPGDAEAVGEIIKEFKPQLVFFAAEADDVAICGENKTETEKLNTIAPVKIAETAASHNAEAFVYVAAGRDVPGEDELFKEGREAVCGASLGNMRLLAVSVRGLLREGGFVSRMARSAAAGEKIELEGGEKRAFISCRSAARGIADIALKENGGQHVLQGSSETDTQQLARALSKLCG